MKPLVKVFVFVQFLYSVSLANGLDLYGYEQRIQLSPVSTPTQVKVVLPLESRQVINADFSNLDLINARNETVPFSLHTREQQIVADIDRVTVSSIKQDNDPADLLDNDRATHFSFDERVDGAEASTLLVDFGEALDLHRVEFKPLMRTQVRGYQMRVGTDVDRLKTVKNKSAFTEVVDGVFPPARFVELSFWGPSVKFEDILFYHRPVVEVYFTAEPGMSYRLLLGNPAVSVYRFQQRLQSPKTVTTTATLAALGFNALANEDLDVDDVINTEDNCPFVANKNQKDNDQDGIGDECDNAPKQKNYDQSDVDGDGVGDIADNCKLRQNPLQYDTDKDGIGNECDTSIGGGIKDTETSLPGLDNKNQSGLFWLGLLLALGLGAAGWWFTRRTKQ